MADKTYIHPIGAVGDPVDVIPSRLRDESDGTWSEAHRARLEVWDAAGAQWIKAKANPNGALLLDRGGAGADISASATYTTSQSGTILASATSAEVLHVTAVMVAHGSGGSATPLASVSVGSNVVALHPGIPAGGGYALTDIDLADTAGSDLTFTCDAPTGASLSVVVHYYLGDS
jgi:hypothetical protein